jgi:hypothetical protein
MTDILVTKAQGGILIPVDGESHEYLRKLKLGDVLKVSVTRANNPKFHRKLMALFQVGYEAWEPGEHTYKGEVIAKNFDQFRNDCTVLAGYFDSAVTLKGEVRLTAKSLSFASMSQDEREKLYSAVIDVLLQRVLRNYTRDDLDNVVNRIVGFT